MGVGVHYYGEKRVFLKGGKRKKEEWLGTQERVMDLRSGNGGHNGHGSRGCDVVCSTLSVAR